MASLASAMLPQNGAAVAAADGSPQGGTTGIGLVYARPNVDFRAYNTMLLEPIEVSFKIDRFPGPAGRPVSARERQEMRRSLAVVIREELEAELIRTGRYAIVGAPARDALRIKAAIRDLHLHAPDLQLPGPARTYTVAADAMTLIAEVRDSTTGDLLARVVEPWRDPESPWLLRTTLVANETPLRRAAARWATILRQRLDTALVVGNRR